MPSSLRSGASTPGAAPPLSQRCWASPGRPSQAGLREREPLAATGKGAPAPTRSGFSQLISAPGIGIPAGPWALPPG